jgi:protocatechuate 3,4-dioxygenase beta subunit
MPSGTKLSLASVAAAALVVLAVVLLLVSERHALSPEDERQDIVDQKPAAADAAEREPTRAELPAEPSARQHSQGVRGRVVDEAGAPVANATVRLDESLGQSDPFAALLRSRGGAVVAPVAATKTDPLGRFELGVRTVAPGGYDLHVIGERYVGQTVPGLVPPVGRYLDLGDVTLPRGLTLTGRVTGHGEPIADARVTVWPASAVSGAVPGRTEGLEVRTDAAGHYRVDNLPDGLASVAAVASGFAPKERQSVAIRPDAENCVDFELPEGLSIRGMVVDAEGRPIAKARVDAVPVGATDPEVVSAETDATGRFEVLGLVAGPYHMIALADSFGRDERKPVQAGAKDARFVLRRNASIAVRALGRDGPLAQWTALLRAYDAARDTIGPAPTARLWRVAPGDLEDGWFRIPDVGPGTWVVELEADGHARTFSPPVVVARDAADPAVEVALQVGGTLTGRVLGHGDEPVPGVRVESLPDLPQAGLLAEMVGAMRPHRYTYLATQTGPDGAFSLPHLLTGSYRIRFEHPAYAIVRTPAVVVSEGETGSLGVVTLVRGAEVRGTVTLDGAPAAGVKVWITGLPDPNEQTAPVFRAEAETAQDGTFVVPRRLPAGRYDARAMRQAEDNPELRVQDLQDTRRELTIAPGQQSLKLNFSLKRG